MTTFQGDQVLLRFSLAVLLANSLGSLHVVGLNKNKACKVSDIFNTWKICPADKVIVPFSRWRFSRNDLLERFPIDAEKRNYVRDVFGAVFSRILPEPLKTARQLVAVSADALSALDLDAENVKQSSAFVDVVSGNVVLDSVPLAHRYGGHQFGTWADQLGDGRAALLGVYVNNYGERWELQLKGSGKTPYSRRGDGRAVLRSSVREFLASEAMYHLGVPTSRAASLVVSDDPVIRDQFYDGHPQREKAAVVLRLAKSWFRIGSLEILHSRQEFGALRLLVDFVMEHHFPHLRRFEDRYLRFFSVVVAMTADMVAHWQSVGFAHGVCNTDNFSLLSITIDYGPFGFLDKYDPGFVPNTSDDEGRYQFANQPEVAFFNLNKLRQAMETLFNDTRIALRELHMYGKKFTASYYGLMRKKLGLLGEENEDTELVDDLLELMQTMFADFTMTFRELSELSLADLRKKHLPEEFWSLSRVVDHDDWKEWLERYSNRLGRQAGDSDEKRLIRMQAANPRYVLRNYMAEVAIQRANHGDFIEVQQLLSVLTHPFKRQALAENSGYAAKPPNWSSGLRVSCSS